MTGKKDYKWDELMVVYLTTIEIFHLKHILLPK